MEKAKRDDFQKAIIKKFGAKEGATLSQKYENAFHHDYFEHNSVDDLASDVVKLEKLTPEQPFEIDFYETHKDEKHPLHLRIYQYDKLTPLSDILPMLENTGLKTYEEFPYEITFENHASFWISDFRVEYTFAKIDIPKIKPIFQEAFTKIRYGVCENDGFNKLVLAAHLTWREIVILRAYAKYIQQTGFRFSPLYTQNAFANHPSIARDLVDLFILNNDPEKISEKNKISQLEIKIQQTLDTVTSLDEDRIFRTFLALIKATLRTNYFLNKDYVSFKFDSKQVPGLPLPKPLYEIFVYSARFEGIHLRGAKVARGGIRWSDRPEDFRTEILGLMKAQRVKNAVIVPSGAKGGFVLKMVPPGAPREVVQKEVIECYKFFIRGLLDLTDNIKSNKEIRPAGIVCHDDFDPYLVVAADKGTATFSDTANGLSKEYHFWLGDAFASGGSAGYDHKKMGITARGAWESVKRHFRELNTDIENTDFTVVGVGDMSGDVFGNGMLYNKHIKLIAAFDHRNIFIDPNPNPLASYEERARLFNLPTSSWEDYNAQLISEGGGIFKRSVKSITITPQMKAALGIEESALAPNDLMKAILKAPVDLFFNGGIGTYVKSSQEAHFDVGDRANEFLRINGNELRCKAVGEGGNLGFTQLGRVEYALNGGLINTDFIDNSAGVDCSDHEVNLKILLDKEIYEGKLAEKDRNPLLTTMTDEVAKTVLSDNYNQALVMSYAALNISHQIGLLQSLIRELETVGGLDRAVEFLPDDKKLMERKASNQGLTRPELAVLLAYSKIYIKQEILKTDLDKDPYLNQIVSTAFPPSLKKSYNHAMQNHPLRREIIATQLSNQIVNEMGFTFAHRMEIETGASVGDIIRAFIIASTVFNSAEIQRLIDSLSFKIPITLQYELLYDVRRLILLATRWFLHESRSKGDLAAIIKHYSENINKLRDVVPVLMTGATKDFLDTLTKQFIKAGLSEDLARQIAACRALYITLNITEVATENKFELMKAAEVYFAVGRQFGLVNFRDQIASDKREGYWNARARLTLREELDVLQKLLTVVVIKVNQKENDVEALLKQWTDLHKGAVERWNKILEMLNSSAISDYTIFFITLREFMNLAHMP